MLLGATLLTFPDIDPVALSLGPVAVRWYGLAYIAGILLAAWYIRAIDRRGIRPLLATGLVDDMVVWAILGVIVGGRLGYVVFYHLPYFMAHPEDIVKIWEGGMSFHGGALGVILAFYGFARTRRLPYVALMDRICCGVPIGLFFGRLANFVNGELYGRVSDVPWAMVFPRGGHYPRHPSQLYEAALEGLALWALLTLIALTTRALHRPGILSGAFLAGYGLARFTVEFFRAPDPHLGLVLGPLTMGQLLSLPMVLAGLALALWGRRVARAPV